MHPKPHKFLTFLFSLLPGAGHMYFGLMKRGISFMILFCACFAGIAILNRFFIFQQIAWVFALTIPVAWFVAFFDFWRLVRMTQEEKTAAHQNDALLFIKSNSFALPSGFSRRARIVAGILLIAAAIQILMEQSGLWWQYRPFFGAATIIGIGLLLIFWKARKPKQEAAHDEK